MSAQVTVKLTVDELDKVRRLISNARRRILIELEHPQDPMLTDTIKALDRELFAIDTLERVFS